MYFSSIICLIVLCVSVFVKCEQNSQQEQEEQSKQQHEHHQDQLVEDIEEDSQQQLVPKLLNNEAAVDPNGFFNRMNRLFPYFNLVKFPEQPCSTSLGYGVCIPSRECRVKGGNSIGGCAQGFGSCCTFKRSCEDSGDKEIIVRENATVLITSEDTSPSNCRFTFPKARGICQLRLDFTEFQLEDGQTSGNCARDSISITGAVNLKEPLKLCGNSKDQHIYLTFGNSDKIYLQSTLSSNTAKYSITVSQIKCNSVALVPSHCSQYYTGETGIVRSFNFGFQQLNNQQYTICIQEAAKAQSVHWRKCDDPRSFQISGSPTDPAITNPEECTKDYIQIFGDNKQCGNQFKNSEINAKPFLMQVNFDSVEAPEPFQCVPIPAIDDASCTSESKPGVLICSWDYSANSCCCRQVNPVIPDINNTGFCLQYIQTY